MAACRVVKRSSLSHMSRNIVYAIRSAVTSTKLPLGMTLTLNVIKNSKNHFNSHDMVPSFSIFDPKKMSDDCNSYGDVSITAKNAQQNR